MRRSASTILCLLLLAFPLRAQNVPNDLEVVGTAGAAVPGGGYASVQIGADGQGVYRRFASGDLLADPVEAEAFTVSAADLTQLWQAVESNNFFALEDATAAGIVDRSFASLTVRANGTVHTVSTRNIAVAGFDAVVSVVNELTPGDRDLIYDTSEPEPFTERVICAEAGKRDALIPAIGKETKQGTPPVRVAATAQPQHGDGHAGTTVAYHLTLQEAVDRGIVTLSAKGEYFGDAVSISADNTSSIKSDQLKVSLYLEFWGPAATIETAQQIEQAIEQAWGGKTTTGGETLGVDVITKTAVGGTSAPGTPGYHQIELRESVELPVAGMADVNQSVESGTWYTKGKAVEELYAHEAGHLMGFDDQYDDYRKQPDGDWKKEGTNETITTDQLAEKIDAFRDDLTLDEVKAKLATDEYWRVTVPYEGFEDDLMGNLDGQIPQKYIDALAAQAGLIIEIRPGDILLSKNAEEQNLAITRSEDLFIPAGETKTLNGLYAACIDEVKDIPDAGLRFDVGPPVSTWNGVEAAGLLEDLLAYIDEQERFCEGDDLAQAAVWRITNNRYLGSASVADFLQEAGLDFEIDEVLDFPRMSNPNAVSSSTEILTPPELFVPVVTASPGNVLSPGTPITLTGALQAPAGENPPATYSWTLERAPGSSAALTAGQGASSAFTPDVRGIYRVRMQAQTDSRTVATVVPFTAADDHTETFESGVLDPDSPVQWGTSAIPWVMMDGAAHTGNISIMAGDVGSNEATAVAATFEQLEDGPFTFAFKVSSEEGYDELTFWVDNVEVGRWSGERDWDTFTVPLSAGTHQVLWTYNKDEDVTDGADRAWIDDVFFPPSALVVALEASVPDEQPDAYRLDANYPNPFNPTTTIPYAVPEEAHVTLVVYDVAGRQVATLVDGRRNAGAYRVRFDAQGLSNGVYVYELRAGDFSARRTMVVLK